MAKKRSKPEPPAVGDNVVLRGRKSKGVLVRHNTINDWCNVDWTSGTNTPKICHYFELEKDLDDEQARPNVSE